MRFHPITLDLRSLLRFVLWAIAVGDTALSRSDALFAQTELAWCIAPSPMAFDKPSTPVRLAEEVTIQPAPLETIRPTAPPAQRAPNEISHLAAQKAALATLMRGDLQADQAGVIRPSKKHEATLALRGRVQDFRIHRQTQLVAAQALELHYGLATLSALEPWQRESEAVLKTYLERQNRAVEQGISIIDPTAIARLQQTHQDAFLQSQSKAAELRSQLALLIDASIACHYLPEPMANPEWASPDPCEMIEQAKRQRCDLAGLVYLRTHLSEETLDVARWMSDVLSGSAGIAPGVVSTPLALIGILTKREKQAREKELCARLAMLDEAINILRAKIGAEVEIALNKQATAFQRFQNAKELVELWQTRVDQLRAYGDQIKPSSAEELESELQLIKARSNQLQIQGEWHQAIVELALAMGCLP